MKSKSWAVLGLVLLCAEARAQLTTNRWITAGSGFWTNAASWSAGVAPTISHAAINITNATTKTVTINAQTADANLTISNLFVAGPAGTVNTLQITNAPAKTLRVLNSLVVTNGGALVVTNSTVRVDTTCSISGVLSNRAGGLLVLTNASTVLRGAIFGVGGAMLASNVTLTGVGTFTHEGGTNTLSGALTVGSGANATGTVWVTGGRWVVTNALTLIGTTAGTGLSAAGQLTVSNGTMLAKDMSLCEFFPSRGTLTVAGGTLAMTGPLTVGVDPSLTGTVWVTGGQLVVTNTPASVSAGSGLIVDGSVSVNTGCSITVSNLPTVVGNTGSGSLTSFGSVLFHNLTVGNLSGSRGTITFGGGTSRILQPASIGVGGPGTVTVNGGDHAAYSGMILGNFNCTATGTVVVAGGRLDVTNASANAVLEVRSGTVQLNSGTLTINTLVVTNACGRFIKAGGTLSITTTNLAPNLDADGDGWSNNHEAAAGTDPFNSASMPTVTSWKTAGDGKWETDGNWSVSAPSAQFQQVLVTNATTKTVTIDAVTTNFPGTLTISNLTVSAPNNVTNTLSVTNVATPFRVLNTLSIGSRGVLQVTNSTVLFNSLLIGGSVRVNGGGQLLRTNSFQTTIFGDQTGQTGAMVVAGGVWIDNPTDSSPIIGNAGVGQLTLNNGTVDHSSLRLGLSVGGVGTLNLAGGVLDAAVVLGATNGGVGTMWITGGAISNGIAINNGRLVVSNSFVSGNGVFVNNGTFHYEGGTGTLATVIQAGTLSTGSGAIWVNAGQLSVNSSIVIGGAGVAQMALSNAAVTASSISLGLLAGGNGTLTLAGAANLQLSGNLTVATVGTGAVWMTGGSLSASMLNLGVIGRGQMTISNGTVQCSFLNVPSQQGSGTLTMTGGTNNITTWARVGNLNGGTGTVAMTGGRFGGTNILFIVGDTGPGTFTLTSGSVWAGNTTFGNNGIGTFTQSGGDCAITGPLNFGGNGRLWLTGGRFVITNDPASVTSGTGFIVDGSATVGSGSLVVSNLDTTVGLRGTGTLSVNAGSILLSNTVLGAHDCSAAGVVSVTGGSFTNATLDIRSGTFTMSAGTVGIGELVITNACGRLIRTGGTLSAGTTNLAPNLSAAGDGLPNGWKQSFGLDPFNPSLANQDPDGDGRPNGFEFENGTDPTVAQSTNSWTSATGGKWEDGTRWLLGAPSIAHALILITNANTKTVTADATTGTNTLRIFALKIAGPNTLRLDNAGTLTMVNHLRIETGGTLSISNSSARVDGVLSGAALNMEGAFDAANGALTATSLPLTVNGPFSMTGGTLTVAGLNVATQAGMTGAVTLANTAVTPGDIFVAPTAGARGELRILGAPAPVTPQYVFIGWNSFASAGNADLLLSNATLQVDQQLFVGGRNSRSTATLRDATVEIGGVFRVGNEFASTGEVWMVGGQLRSPSLLIGGEAATGRLSVSNGIVRTSGIDIGFEENAEATLTVAGGTVSADFGVTIGHCSLSTSNCVLAVTGGSLFVTNATGDAELVLERGTLLLSAGTIVADRIVMNSACVNFVRTGGTLIYGTAVLNPADDTDGDGLSNGYEQANGLDPLDPTDAAADTDGDGFTNLQEYLAGTDPLDSASALRITAITREADDIRVTWMTAAGKTNALERTAGVAGSFTNNFTVLTNIVTTGTSTNVLDVGAATNVPAFYYRVRLVP